MGANPTTEPPLQSVLRHRRESFWQITFPVIAVAVLSLAGVVALYLVTGREGTSVVADYSLALVMVPVCMVGFILLAVNAGLIYAIIWLVARIPRYTNSAQRGMLGVYSTVDSLMDKLTSIIIHALAVLRVLGNAVDEWSESPNGNKPESQSGQ